MTIMIRHATFHNGDNNNKIYKYVSGLTDIKEYMYLETGTVIDQTPTITHECLIQTP